MAFSHPPSTSRGECAAAPATDVKCAAAAANDGRLQTTPACHATAARAGSASSSPPPPAGGPHPERRPRRQSSASASYSPWPCSGSAAAPPRSAPPAPPAAATARPLSATPARPSSAPESPTRLHPLEQRVQTQPRESPCDVRAITSRTPPAASKAATTGVRNEGLGPGLAARLVSWRHMCLHPNHR